MSGASLAARRIAAGRPEATPTGEVRVVPLPKDANGVPREALLLRDEAGALHAYLNRCRHLPTTLDAAGRKFFSADRRHLQCQTHGALYRLTDGYCVEGPCEGTALYRLELEVDGDTLFILLED